MNKEDSDENSDTESLKEPPVQDLTYHRSWKAKLTLIILPPLYFSFLVIAIVVTFFTIESLVLSYRHKVRSVKYVTVDQYPIIGVAMLPSDLVTFHSCEFLYADSLHQDDVKWEQLSPPNQICNWTNVTFYSRTLNRNRTAMVFEGPTLVHLKQSLALHFTMDTEREVYSAIEYLLLGYWSQEMKKSSAEQAKYLENLESKFPSYTVPAGFRSWVKLSYVVYSKDGDSRNISDFNVQTELSSYNGQKNESSTPLLALFEWKEDSYQYVTDILSTTLWNTLGSLAGIFITFVRVWETGKRWINRVRRERTKKRLRSTEIEENHRRKLENYWRKKIEKRLNDLDRRLL